MASSAVSIGGGRRRVRTRRVLRSLGPAISRPKRDEIWRGGAGAAVGLAVCGLILSLLGASPGVGLIAPLGASAVLLFAVPNSPLAQPWSAVVGNTASALLAVAVVSLVDIPLLAAAIAAGGSIFLMQALRALHPPGGAVALTVALGGPDLNELGYAFALVPVGVGTAGLVVLAVAYNRLTGRKYPFRQPTETTRHATRDRLPERRLGLSADDLASILEEHRLSANVGVEDLARLIVAAEAESARRQFGHFVAADAMSRDLVTVAPNTRLSEISELFRKHRIKTIPVVGPERRLYGVITPSDIIERAPRTPLARTQQMAAAAIGTGPCAEQVMTRNVVAVSPSTALGELLSRLSDSGVGAVPVVQDERLVGIVTRTDLLSVLALPPNEDLSPRYISAQKHSERSAA